MAMFEMNADQAAIYSDMHKDAYGFRPRAFPMFECEADFKLELDGFVTVMVQDSNNELKAYDRWIFEMHKFAKTTNNKISDVIRWAFDGHGLNVNKKFDREAFCYEMGFKFEMGNLIAKTQ